MSLATVNPGGSGIWLDSAAGNKLMAGATEIGTADAASAGNGVAWSLSFNASATNALAQDVARAVIFNNSRNNPSALDRTVTFTVMDAQGAAASVAQKVSVTTVNDPPSLIDFTGSANEDTTITFVVTDFTSHFTDVNGDSLSAIKVTLLPGHGTLQLSAKDVTLNQEISAADLANLAFVPTAHWYGSDSFGWQASDGTAYSAAAATVNLTVIDNVAPTLTTPLDNATAVAVSDNIVLTFSEAVKAGTGNIIISNGNGDTRTIDIANANDIVGKVTINGSTVTINPATDLNLGSSYNVQMASGVIKDLADNSFAGISDATTLNFAVAPNAVSSNGQPIYTYNGHAYQWTTAAMTWAEAEAEAIAHGGHLISVNSVEEDQFLFNHVGNAGVWLGFNDIQEEGKWVWTDGSDVSYVHWYWGEPNNSEGEDTGVTWGDECWNDIRGTLLIYGVIEYPSLIADTTAPTLTNSNPVDNATAVGVSDNIVLTFSEAVKAGTGNITFSNGVDAPLTMSVTDYSHVTINENTITINPAADLRAGSSYHVQIDNGAIKDLAENPYAGISDATTLNFTTARLENRGGGLIYDSAQNMTWLQDADYVKTSGYDADGAMNWDEAYAWAQNVLYYDSARNIYWQDMRLPDSNSNGSYGCTSPEEYAGLYTALGGGFDNSFDGRNSTIENQTIFSNVSAGWYWTNTNRILNEYHAWGYSFDVSYFANGITRTDGQHAWLVRSGDVSGYALHVANPTDSIIGAGSAQFGGTITDVAGGAITERGVYWSTDSGFAPGQGTKISETGNFSTGAFSENVSNLRSGSIYYRAYAVIDSAGIAFSDVGIYHSDATVPALTLFSAPVDTTRENSTVEITLAELKAQGDEADTGGTVDAFVIKELSAGSLKIGHDLASALAFDVSTNNTIDADHNAYWSPAINVHGTLNAFTVVAKDNSGDESVTPVQAMVSVTFDTVSPTLVSSSPAHNAAFVSVGSNIVLTFSEAVQIGTGDIIISDGTDTHHVPVIDPAQVTIIDNTVTINPANDLQAGHTYNVQIGSGVIKDLAGNPFAGIIDSTTLNFKTLAVLENRGGGLIYDPNQNMTWLQDADYAKTSGYDADGVMNWDEAYAWAQNVLYYDSARNIYWQDMRLPDSHSGGYYGCTNPEEYAGLYTALGGGFDNYGDGRNATIENQTIFSNVSAGWYWTNTNRILNEYNAWGYSFDLSYFSNTITRTDGQHAWLVRSGDVSGYALHVANPTDSALGAGTAQFGGTITDVAGGAITERGIYWSTDSAFAPGQGTKVSETGNFSTGTFGVDVSGLPASTIYFRAYAVIDNVGLAFSDVGTYLVDTTAPTLITSIPIDNATAVGVSDNIVLTFSEAVKAGTGNITFSNGVDTPLTMSVTDSKVTINENIVTINPAADLRAGSSYHVQIDNGAIKDLAENPYAGISDATTLNFNTSDVIAQGTFNGHQYEIITVPGEVTWIDAKNAAMAKGGYLATINSAEEDQFVISLFNNSVGGTVQRGSWLVGPWIGASHAPARGAALASNWTWVTGEPFVYTNWEQYFGQPDGADAEINVSYGRETSVDTQMMWGDLGSDQYGFGIPISYVVEYDTVAPTLSSSTPIDNATSIAVGSDIVLTFSEAVKAGTGNIVISNGTDTRTISVTDNIQLSISGSTATINPTTDLHQGSSYNVQLASGVIKDLAGNAYAGISDATTLNFNTVVINDAPTLTDFTGGGNEDATITFAKTDFTNHYSDLDGDALAQVQITALPGHGTLKLSGADVTLNQKITAADLPNLTFVPTAHWHGSDSFGWQASDGTAYSAESATVNLTVADNVAPTVTSMSPADNAIAVAIDSNIVLTFSEAVKAGSGTIAIHSASATGSIVESYDVAGNTNLTIEGNTLTINPTANLANSSHYFVTFEAGAIKDTAGNSFAGTPSYDFVTENVLNDLIGSAKFWKTGAPISNVTSTLTPSASSGHPIEFRNIQTAADGSRTIEIWENSTRTDISDLSFDLALPTGSVPTWQAATTLPAGWNSFATTTVPGALMLGGIGSVTTPLSAGSVKLGTLTLSAPTNPSHFDLTLTMGNVGGTTIPSFGIVSDTSTTGSNGLYQHLDFVSDTYTLQTTKPIDATIRGIAVTSGDALAALKIALLINPNSDGSPVSPYQYLAADVNKDGRVTSGDALNILKMAIKYSGAPANEWLFVEPSVGTETMSRTAVHWPVADLSIQLDHNMELDLIGIVKGDINGSWVG